MKSLPTARELNVSIDIGSPPHVLGDEGTPDVQGDREHSPCVRRLRALPSRNEVGGHSLSLRRLGVLPISREVGSAPYLSRDSEHSLLPWR
jgi:hypothetical protein